MCVRRRTRLWFLLGRILARNNGGPRLPRSGEFGTVPQDTPLLIPKAGPRGSLGARPAEPLKSRPILEAPA